MYVMLPVNVWKASKTLIPLSYSTIAGGLCSTIGTSTNLMIQGLLINNGKPPLGFFEPGYVGFVLLALCIAFTVIIGQHILPVHGG